MRGWLAECTCEIDVAMSFLMLASITMKTVDGEEEIQRTILSSSWMWVLSFSFLLTKLKEKQSEKLSDKQKPEINSQFKGEKDGKMP